MLAYIFDFIEKVYARNYVTGKTQKGPAVHNAV